jgi:hypothetical protein
MTGQRTKPAADNSVLDWQLAQIGVSESLPLRASRRSAVGKPICLNDWNQTSGFATWVQSFNDALQSVAAATGAWRFALSLIGGAGCSLSRLPTG